MISTLRALTLGVTLVIAATTLASAQEPPPSPQPAGTSVPTVLDQQYDGKTHLTITPYIWGPTVHADFQYQVPPVRRRHGGGRGGQVIGTALQVGPSDYLPKLNTAGMLDVDIRQGNVDLFGDAIYLNASTTATITTIVSGPRGRIQFPVTIDSSARLATAIWQVGLGYTLARGHSADLSMFAGFRSFPVNLTADYNTFVGNKRYVGPAGTITTSDNTSDAIWGLRGKAFFGNDRWVVPYYIDVGQGTNNQSWQAYGGAGYVFNHGQSIFALYRTLNYNAFPPTAHVQKLSMYGPLLGYSF
jgi:hypothetical protein